MYKLVNNPENIISKPVGSAGGISLGVEGLDSGTPSCSLLNVCCNPSLWTPPRSASSYPRRISCWYGLNPSGMSFAAGRMGTVVLCLKYP